MKANELMVGDYLMHNGFPYRVIQIDGIVRDGWMIENGEEDCGEPIPLTPEILEKNGFKWLLRDSKYITYCIKESTIHVTKYKVTGEWLICAGASGSATKRFVEVSCVNYVHELQHALKLCGIKKEIEL